MFKVIEGQGDLIEAIDKLRARAVAGEIDCLAFVSCDQSLVVGTYWHLREDAVAPWARLTSGVGWLHHRLISDG